MLKARSGGGVAFGGFVAAALFQEVRHDGFSRIPGIWRQRRDYRRELRRLLRVGPHMIADIGLTVEEARDEVTKPLWVP